MIQFRMCTTDNVYNWLLTLSDVLPLDAAVSRSSEVIDIRSEVWVSVTLNHWYMSHSMMLSRSQGPTAPNEHGELFFCVSWAFYWIQASVLPIIFKLHSLGNMIRSVWLVIISSKWLVMNRLRQFHIFPYLLKYCVTV